MIDGTSSFFLAHKADVRANVRDHLQVFAFEPFQRVVLVGLVWRADVGHLQLHA